MIAAAARRSSTPRSTAATSRTTSTRCSLVYIILIFIRVLLSWIPPGRMPYNPPLSAVVDFVHQTTDPYLNFFRRFLPADRAAEG